MLTFLPGLARADCNPADFAKQDILAGTVDEKTAIAFLKIATNEQYKTAQQKASTGASWGGILSGNAEYGTSQI
jgi:hypothetical protein